MKVLNLDKAPLITLLIMSHIYCYSSPSYIYLKHAHVSAHVYTALDLCRLGTGSWVIRETTQTGCPWSGHAFLYLSMYLSVRNHEPPAFLGPTFHFSAAQRTQAAKRAG